MWHLLYWCTENKWLFVSFVISLPDVNMACLLLTGHECCVFHAGPAYAFDAASLTELTRWLTLNNLLLLMSSTRPRFPACTLYFAVLAHEGSANDLPKCQKCSVFDLRGFIIERGKVSGWSLLGLFMHRGLFVCLNSSAVIYFIIKEVLAIQNRTMPHMLLLNYFLFIWQSWKKYIIVSTKY